MKTAALAVVASTLGLLLLEGGLRLLTPFPITTRSHTLPDPVLGHRMDPDYDGIDRNGFRNPTALERADVAVLGDSHTYGNNVVPADSWPQRLASGTGLRVYNFGMGRYGLLQYNALLGRALALEPSWVILALYVSNDLADVCGTIRTTPHWSKQASGLGFDPALCASAPDADAIGPEGWLERTAIYSALEHHVLQPSRTHYASRSGRSQGVYSASLPGQETLFTRKRLEIHERSTALSRPDVSAAFDLASRMLERAMQRCASAGCSFGVLFVPSKASAYHDLLERSGHRPPEIFVRTVARERRIVASLGVLCETLQIRCVDARPDVEAALALPVRVYPAGTNAHPLAPGYAAYATAATRLISDPPTNDQRR